LNAYLAELGKFATGRSVELFRRCIRGSARASRACFGALAETRGNPAMGSERGSPAIAGRVASPEIDDHVTFARPFAAVNS